MKRFNAVPALLLAALIAALSLTGCGYGGSATDSDSPHDKSSAVQPASEESTVSDEVPKLYDSDVEFDWQSLYYERLRVLDTNVYSECALIYVDDDDVPELFLKTAATASRDYLCSIDKSGLFVNTSFLDPVDSLMYIERQGSVMTMSCYDQVAYYEEMGYRFDPNGQYRKEAKIYSFNGELVREEHSYYKDLDDLADDDGLYDTNYADEESGVRIPEDIKGYFDADIAVYAETYPIGTIIDLLKGLRKDPDLKAGQYDSASPPVITYNEFTKTIRYYGNDLTVSYKIPQIDLRGGDIDTVNKEILDDMTPLVDEIESNGAAEHLYYKMIDYRAFLSNGVLSLVIDKTGTGGTDGPSTKVIYNIDLSAKKRINNICLLNSFGTDCAKVEAAFEKYNEADYYDVRDNSEYPLTDMGYDDAVYDRLIKMTLEMFSPVGTHMFFDDKGDLHIYYYRAWIAGAGYTGEEMTVGKSELVG